MKPPTDLSHKGRAVEEWLDLRFFRPAGIRVARALLGTGVSADQVTLWSLAIGLVAGHLFAYRDRWTNAIGFALFIVSDIFDSADGQLARLRGTSTRFGRALDGISDNLRFLNLYCHLLYRLIRAGTWWPGATLLVALAGLAHAYQSAAVDFVRNAFLAIGIGDRGELDLPEDLAPGRRARRSSSPARPGWCDCCGGGTCPTRSAPSTASARRGSCRCAVGWARTSGSSCSAPPGSRDAWPRSFGWKRCR